uniref:Spt20-like SEP domain-containing protein n=1 Tax=Felis catus TaxID=9685 RepID=A0ABI7ZBB7_FELCA
MQQSLEQALDCAEYVIASAQQRPPKRKGSASGGASLDEKLYDLYVEECGKEPEATEELRSNVNLLEKLLRRESLPCLVVNLYPGKEGYSLMLEGENGSYSETIRLPYEEGELLEYLDAEQLPPALVDLLEKSQVNFFHSGCVIAQVRDYRQCSREPPGYASRHVLLRPTMQTLACDVQSMTGDDQTWTQEDRFLLESQLILATAEPLCLDPSVSVSCTANRLLYNKQKMNTGPMKRSFKRYSAPSLNRQQELSHRPPPPELRVWPSYKKSRESTTSENCDFVISKPGNYVDTWKQRPCDLAVPSEVDVQKYAKWEKFVKYDESQPTDWPAHEAKDDFEFGYEGGDESQSPPAFMQSLNDPLISGKRRVRKKIRYERQASPPHSSTGDHSTSVLPRSKSDAGREVTVSQSSSGSASLSQLPPGKETEEPDILCVQSSVLGKAVSHPSPAIKPPSSSGKTWSGNSFTPWQGSSFLKSPSPAPASKTLATQKSSAKVTQVRILPKTTISTTGSSQRSLATQSTDSSAGPNIIQVVGPVSGVQAWARDSSLGQGSTTGATAPAGIKPSNLPSGSWPPNVGPTALQPPSQAGAQFFFKDAPSIRPVSMFQLPQGSYLLNTQQLNTQQHQQPTAPHPQQPVSQGSSAQGSTSQRTALSAQQAVVLNLAGAQSLLQPLQAAVLSPLGCVESQRRPEQSGSQHTLQLSSLRILPHPVPLTTVAAPTAQPHPSSEQTANQSTGKMKKGTPTTPKS